MQRATKRILQAAGLGSAEDVQTPAVYAQTGRHILRQVDELLQHQDSLANPDERERHHAMRIATKRLRYTLEIARPVYPGRLEEAVEAIKRVQSLLGEVHDCDVWAEHLDAFAAAERERITALFGHAGRFTRLQPGIDFLRADRRRHRQEVFGQLVEYWAELGRRRFWDGLDQRGAGPRPVAGRGDRRSSRGRQCNCRPNVGRRNCRPPSVRPPTPGTAVPGLAGDSPRDRSPGTSSVA